MATNINGNVTLGKLPPKIDERTLQLSNYLTREMPLAPETQDWTKKVQDWDPLGNHDYGDCVQAGALHMQQNWTAYDAPEEFVPTTQQALDAYAAITGFKKGDPSTDRGTRMIDALNHWRRNGIGGNSILGYAACEPQSTESIKDAIVLFQAAYIGIGLPLTAQNQTVWSVPPGGPFGRGGINSWGGHAIPLIAYDRRQLICVTWGRLQAMTWGFLRTYCDEAYAVLSDQWTGRDEVSPNGFTLQQLKKDLAEVTG